MPVPHMILPWDAADGPPPVPEAIEVGARTIIWIVGGSQQPAAALFMEKPGHYLVVSGVLDRDELLRVAASFPHAADR
jgi:hypothetical protein